MPEQPLPSQLPSAPEVLASLHAVAGLLREGQRLGPEEQRAVAELVDELARAVESPQGSSPALVRLAEGTAQLLRAVHERHDAGLLASARLRLEEALLDAEERAPLLVGLLRRVTEALAGSGV